MRLAALLIAAAFQLHAAQAQKATPAEVVYENPVAFDDEACMRDVLIAGTIGGIDSRKRLRDAIEVGCAIMGKGWFRLNVIKRGSLIAAGKPFAYVVGSLTSAEDLRATIEGGVDDGNTYTLRGTYIVPALLKRRDVTALLAEARAEAKAKKQASTKTSWERTTVLVRPTSLHYETTLRLDPPKASGCLTVESVELGADFVRNSVIRVSLTNSDAARPCPALLELSVTDTAAELELFDVVDFGEVPAGAVRVIRYATFRGYMIDAKPGLVRLGIQKK